MNPNQKAAVILALADKMKSQGSWCGETHLQKAIFFLQESCQIPLGFEYILYKHGPFSFDLRDQLTEFRADSLLQLENQPFPYGPSLSVTEQGQKLMKEFPRTLKKYNEGIEVIADKLGSKGVAELERLGTALYLIKTAVKLTKH